MKLDEILLAITRADKTLPTEGLALAKANWSLFQPEIYRLIEQLILDEASLSEAQKTTLFYGTLLAAELQCRPMLEQILQLFSRKDDVDSTLDTIFEDTITELTPSVFYNLADGESQVLSNYIIAHHSGMYCKAAAMEAVFAMYEVGAIEQEDLLQHIDRWLSAFLAIPSKRNGFLLSVLANLCITYQFDQFKPKFVGLLNKDIMNKDYISADEVTAWDNQNALKLVEKGFIQTQFKLVDTLNAWFHNNPMSEKTGEKPVDNELNAFDDLMAEGGMLSNLLYNEQDIIANSVPVSSVNTARFVGRNDPCPCGSGKKYKKCCLH